MLNATYRESHCSEAGIKGGIVENEVKVADIGTTHRTAPIIAVGTGIADRTIVEVAVARLDQLKRGGKSAS